MQGLVAWTLDAIRADDGMMNWMEERRFDWVPVVQNALKHILEGRTIILITDYERRWFQKYAMSRLNRKAMDRPIIPIAVLEEIYPHFSSISGGEKIDVLEDMLSLSYGENYFFWYVGKGSDKRADIAKREDNNFLWIFDEDFQNSFQLRSNDALLDIKLLQLFLLLEKTLNAALFGEIELSE